MPSDCQTILTEATETLKALINHVVDVVDVKKPDSIQYAINLSKVISKLSPLIGNMIEFHVVDVLNKKLESDGLSEAGKWLRQDPGFPDTVFVGEIEPRPGIEVKTWFPLATEITARFKDSQSHFLENQTNVCVVAWLPEHIFYGRPKIINVFVDTASSIAKARDEHYHNPPDYIVFEPRDTTARTANLQQTNTNGYKFQGSSTELIEAKTLVDTWGIEGKAYSCSSECQSRLQDLHSRFPYRLDTNFAKMDRIEHTNLETFKDAVLDTAIYGKTVSKWSKVIQKSDERAFQELLARTGA